MPQGEWEIVEAMTRYGGGFVQALGRAFQSADAENKRRLLGAFPELFERYAEIARVRIRQPK